MDNNANDNDQYNNKDSCPLLDGGAQCHLLITESTCNFASKPDQRRTMFKVIPCRRSLGGCEVRDYAALAYATRFKVPSIWTRLDECGRIPLYHACMSYSGIAKDGDRGDSGAMMLLFRKYGLGCCKTWRECRHQNKETSVLMNDSGTAGDIVLRTEGQIVPKFKKVSNHFLELFALPSTPSLSMM